MSVPSTLPWKLRPETLSSSAVCLDHVVALDVLLADIEKADRRPLDAFDRRGQRGAHHGKLDQLLRRAVHVGAEIEHRRNAGPRRQLRGDGRPVDAGQRLQHEARDRHQRAGIAGGDAGLRRAVLHQVHCNAQRRVLLPPQRVGGSLVHLDDFTGRMDREPVEGGRTLLRKHGLERILAAPPRSRARRASPRESSTTPGR